MLKRANRLQSSRDFKRTLAAYKVGANSCFAVYGLLPQANHSGVPKIGFIISKKVAKSSVRRNKIRRRLREILRLWLLDDEKRLALHQYRSLVIIARNESVQASYQELERKMAICFRLRNLPS